MRGLTPRTIHGPSCVMCVGHRGASLTKYPSEHRSIVRVALVRFIYNSPRRLHRGKNDGPLKNSTITKLMPSYPGQNPISAPDLALGSLRIFPPQYLLFKQLLEIF